MARNYNIKCNGEGEENLETRENLVRSPFKFDIDREFPNFVEFSLQVPTNTSNPNRFSPHQPISS
jgi:hypothetical protein